MKYIGIDGCKAGWFYIGFNDRGYVGSGIYQSISELSDFKNSAQCILIDIPIGLVSEQVDERTCDKLARAALGHPRSSSVFPAPSRDALPIKDFQKASQVNRKSTGRGLSKQTFNIMPKIREVDAFLRSEPHKKKVRECHPEVGFWALNNQQSMEFNKKTLQGFEERLVLLRRFYPYADEWLDENLQMFPRKAVQRDYMVDALVCAIIAQHNNELDSFPKQPKLDTAGLPMEIVYWSPAS